MACASSPKPATNPGHGFSRISGRRARPTRLRGTPPTQSPSGWAIRRRRPPSITSWPVSTTSRTWWAAARVLTAARGTGVREAATRIATPQAAAPDSTQPHETTEPAATIQVAAGSSKMTPISGIGLVGNTGFERTAILPSETAEAESECAHLCATSEIPAFVAASGRLAAWDELSEHLRGRLTSLDPDVLTALHALFCGIPR